MCGLVLARREAAAESAPATTKHEASAGRAIRRLSKLTQKVRRKKDEKAVRDKALSEALSGQRPDSGSEADPAGIELIEHLSERFFLLGIGCIVQGVFQDHSDVCGVDQFHVPVGE